MWWGIGGLYAVLWLVLMVWLGLRTLRNGHGWLFFLGIFLPILWIFGAFMRPANAAYGRAAAVTHRDGAGFF